MERQLHALEATRPAFHDLEDEAWTVVEANPADDAAFAALKVLQKALFTDSSQSRLDAPAFQAREARLARMLLDHHLSRADFLDVPYVYLKDRRALIAYWKDVYRGSPHGPVRAEALYRIARGYLDSSEAVGLAPEARNELHGQVRHYARVLTQDYPDTTPAQRVPLLVAALDAPAGTMLAEIEVAKLAGGSDSLRNHRGNVVLLEFWATWCRPCLRDHPKLIALNEELRGRAFEIISVSADDKPEKVSRYLAEERALPWTQWYVGPDGPLLKQWGIQGYPTYLLVSAEGALDARGSTLDDMADRARRLLAQGESK